MASDNNIKGIPYGITDYARIIRDNYYYVDKTHFIPLIEQAASFFFLIRPRRFGKSLLLNMLDSYYDINNANRFEELFSKQWIYKHPTNLRAKFLILRFNFSAVDSTPERLQPSFESHCTNRFEEFCNRYEHLFHPGFRKELMKKTVAADRLQYINSEASFLGLRIYLIIDEYDNFTNSILATMGKEAYQHATHGEGFFRYFFNVIKVMTTGNDTALERMFITGVSPVTLDDVTSGFNIGSNFTISPGFNNIVGFSEAELNTLLSYYHEQGMLKMEVADIMKEMKPWYDNYCFAEEKLGECMYNSDMVLYYLNNCIVNGTPPREMIDKNIRTDYGKLRHLIKIDKELGENFSVIREVVETGRTTATLSDAFSVEKMLLPDNFKSLLYYFGLLSIRGTERGKVVLGIPNHTVREQMYSYLIEGLADTNIFRIDFNLLGELMGNMAYDGWWKPVFSYISSELEKQSRVREFIEGEAHIKGFLLAYLGLTHYYMVLPEYELAKGYVDFYFQPNPQLTDMEY
ncbi:ATP-binding protein, partial [Bacteroides sp. OttesenSCG-928-N06]|nr:ATP-binding protein [Bacteroides sp. OttesenSCG-928-N06]